MTTSPATVFQNGVLTSYIPLTTPGPVFSPTCSGAIYMNPGETTIAAFDPWFGQHINPQLAGCLPKEQTIYWDQLNTPGTTYLLGPFACPTEYTQVATSSVDATSTLIACCPRGYTYQGKIYDPPTPSQCVMTATSGQVVSYIGDSSGVWAQNSTTYGAAGGTIVAPHINGYIFANLTTSSSSSTAGATSTTASTTATVPQQTSPSASSTQSSAASAGLSYGAKVGLGVGITLGVVGILALIAGFLLYRKSRAQRGPALAHESQQQNHFLDPEHQDMPDTPGTSISAGGTGIKKQGIATMTEMYAPPYVAEAPDGIIRAEMEG